MLSHDVDLTYPVIIMRTGGLDGVALQAREYRHLLNSIDISVHVITGRCETKFSPTNPIGHKQTIVSRLDFYDKTSQALFSNQFMSGDEVNADLPVLTEDEWREKFVIHKNKIKERIDSVLKKIPYNTPVLVYNLISLRHAQPAAAVAIKELMLKYPDRAFISHSADPDAERPEKINRIKEFVLPFLSANDETQPYSGGPYHLNNLYHIVLNPTQRDNFINKYDIPANHVFEIPDFLDFPSPQPVRRMFPKRIFLKFMSECCIKLYKKSYKYTTRAVTKETLYFLSPVRPVYRKRLKEAMLIAKKYGDARGRDVVFVVTHPNSDDKNYFMEIIKFADQIDLPFYHLGKSFSLDTLDSVYENLATLHTIGVVASSAGGWENALNEMARACIPFFMDRTLNSYKPLTEEIKIKTLGTSFAPYTKLIADADRENPVNINISEIDETERIFSWLDRMLLDDYRKKTVEYNYLKAYDYLSHEATLTRLVKGINYIYERHGIPGSRVKASTLTKLSHKTLDKDALR
jgi:hypothetical protein